MKDFIFVCGLPGKDRAGLREADKNYTVERFNPGTGQWSLMPALGNPVGGACLVNVKVGEAGLGTPFLIILNID